MVGIMNKAARRNDSCFMNNVKSVKNSLYGKGNGFPQG